MEEEVSEGMLQKIINEIKARYTENISLSELAERYGISNSYLSSLVKGELNLSFLNISQQSVSRKQKNY